MSPDGQDIRIVFTAGTHWISRLIRWALRSKVSHVFIEYPSDLWGGRWVAEATKGGVKKVQAYRARKHIYAEFSCLFSADKGLQTVAKLIGEQYDYVGAFWLGLWSLLKRWFRAKWSHPFRRTKSQFCSEFVASFLVASGMPDTEKWDTEGSGPDALYAYCQEHPGQFDVVNADQLGREDTE